MLIIIVIIIKINVYNLYTNYSVRNIAAFCSAKKDLKTLCLKLASEPFFSNIGIHTVPLLYSPNSETSVSRLYLEQIRFMFEYLVARL